MEAQHMFPRRAKTSAGEAACLTSFTSLLNGLRLKSRTVDCLQDKGGELVTIVGHFLNDEIQARRIFTPQPAAERVGEHARRQVADERVRLGRKQPGQFT